MYSVINTISEYTYFYISKNITSYSFFLVFKIFGSLQCILKQDNHWILSEMNNIGVYVQTYIRLQLKVILVQA